MAAKKPRWVIEKEQSGEQPSSVWLFGIHAVRDALENPNRVKLKLMVTMNAADRLAEAIAKSGVTPEVYDPRKFNPPLDAQSVHQGAALEVEPLVWGSLSEVCAPRGGAPTVLMLDKVTDPHNVGAILRSAEVFSTAAVVAPHRGSAPETGALAKTASGALERQPYLRVQNLSRAIETLQSMGYLVVGLDGEATETIETALALPGPVALVMGAEGAGLRELTRKTCDVLARIDYSGEMGSLNVSNAAAVSLYCATRRPK